MASIYKKQGVGVLVCDPLCSDRWECDWITDDIDEFLSVTQDPDQCLQCALFVDESGMAMGDRKFDTSLHWFTTTSRHHGHVCHLISHKGVTLSPIMRENCIDAYVFSIHIDYAKELAKDLNCPDILEANTLPKGHYIAAGRWRETKRGKVWWA